MKKRIFSFLLAIVMVIGLAPSFAVAASAAVFSGYCGAEGENLTWTYDEETTTLTISGEGAMADCSESCPWADYKSLITAIVVSEGVTSIGDRAFSYCSELEEISLPTTLEEIGSYAFAVSGLVSVDIPDSVTFIDEEAFYQCSKLVSVTLSEGLEVLSKEVFAGCSVLKQISIPASVTEISYHAFRDSPTKITVDENNPKFSSADGVLFNKNKTMLVHFPCKIIGMYTVPSTVTEIGEWAFYRSEIGEIKLPEGLTTIGVSAFYWCYRMTAINIPASVTSIGESAFAFCNDLATVNVSCKWDGSLYTFEDNVTINRPKHKYKDSACTVCGFVCNHDNDSDEICDVCVITRGFAIKSLESPAPISVMKNYPDYVSDWKEFLNLPETLEVETLGNTTETVDIVWDWSSFDPYKEGLYEIRGSIDSNKCQNASDFTLSQIVLVEESKNLIANGDFEEGTANWLGWTKSKATEGENSVLKITHKTPSKTMNGSKGLYQDTDVCTALGTAITSAGLGQYYLGIKVKTIPYDASSTARTDMMAWLAFNTQVTSSGSSTSLLSASRISVSAEEWTSIGKTVNITSSYELASSELWFRSGDSTTPVALYVDDFVLYKLKGTLADPETCEHTYSKSYKYEATACEPSYTLFVCPKCADSYAVADELEPDSGIGHDTSVTDNCDGTHTVTCSKCDLEITEKHSFELGVFCTECGVEKAVDYSGVFVVEGKITGAAKLTFKFEDRLNQYVLRFADGFYGFGSVALYADDEYGTFDSPSSEREVEYVLVVNYIERTYRYIIDGKAVFWEKDGVLVNDPIDINPSALEYALQSIYPNENITVDNVYAIGDSDTAELVALQNHNDEYAVRLLAGVDTLAYSSVGFKIEGFVNGEASENGAVELKSHLVYSSIVALEETVEAEALGHRYLSACTIDGISTMDGMEYYILVTPYVTVGDYIRYGETLRVDFDLDGNAFFAE